MLQKLDTALSWLLVALFFIFYFIYFRLLNRTKVVGLESIIPYLKKGKVIIVTNHCTMLDSILVTFTLCGPWVLRPSFFDRLPYHAAAVEYCFLWWNGWFFRRVRVLPVKSGRRDILILLKMTSLLEAGKSAYLFPQGSRVQTDEIVFDNGGAGYLAHKTGAVVIVGRFQGMEKVWPTGHFLPRIGKRVTLVVSGPVNLSSFSELPANSATWGAITEEIRRAVISL